MKNKAIATIISLLLSLLCCSAQELANVQNQASIVSPEITEEGVTFRFMANYATVVTLQGSWQLPNAKPIKMNKDFNGLWEVTVKGIPADLQTYTFTIDGVSTTDPSNPMVQSDQGRHVSLLYIDGYRTKNYKEASRHHGNVSYVWYDSPILHMQRRMAIYTPYGYNPEDKKKTYPVLYLLHGDDGNEQSWLSMGRAAQILDNLIEAKRAVPMIVVMPNGNPGQQAAASLGLSEIDYKYNSTNFVSSLINEVIPYVEKNYTANPKKSARAIAGVTMGGIQAFNAAALYPDRFDWYGFMSSGITPNEHLHSDLMRIKQAKFKLIWEGAGTYEEEAYTNTKFLYDSLEEVYMDNTLYINNGGHDWISWRQHLTSFVSMLFKFYNDK